MAHDTSRPICEAVFYLTQYKGENMKFAISSS